MNTRIILRVQQIKQICANNIVLKVLSLILAALAYYGIHDATSFEVVYEVPLEFEVENDVAILDQDVRSVQTVLRGSQQDILALDEKKIKAVVKRKTVDSSGSQNVSIGLDDIKGARGVKVVRVRPGQVMVTFDRRGEKVVAVARPQTIGKPLVGRVELEYEPRSVVLRGPEQRLRDKEVVFTEPVDIEGRMGSFTRRVRIVPPSESWKPEIEPAEVTVKVTIAAESTSRQLTNAVVLVMVRAGEAAPKVEPASVSVNLQGRGELLDRLSLESVRVFAGFMHEGAGSGSEIPLQVHLPMEFSDVTATVSPGTVRAVPVPVIAPSINTKD